MAAAARLRAAREAAGLSIEEVAARTRIKPAMLLALEQGDYHRLPGDFFARAFLRTYARELHVPESEVLEAYAADVPAPPQPPPLSEALRHDDLDAAERRASRAGWLIAATVAFVLLSFGVTRDAPVAQPESGAVGTSGSAQPATPAPAPASVPVAASSTHELSMELRPIRPVWVTGYADNERVLYRRVEPSERITLNAGERLTFRVGDAGAFEFVLNGVPGKAPGRDGEVREFTITRANQHEFAR